ncbi:MAG: cytidylate kinase-like family protein [Desulfarculaceae bacterium]|nr:cytidylate kinase-like family protein [Desulfarculaceae bacterium]MCF8073708.1 cytidylate kinase-like family protein [Desulfarculaceae bacterium]MCF8101949.1 cytidylate kinase-like family protein [Desulfarculaceae bacterium]MCF8115919.1 cytidylate kinase-like family protein [Desulfarculaceae bacterium]
MAIITISKEFASGGQILAQRLAEELGYRLVGRKVLAELAARLDLSEGEAELLRRGEDNSLFKMLDEVFLHTVRRIAQKPESALDDHAYFKAVKELIQGVADQGDAVIVGWGGQYLLAGQPETHHLRVVAPLEERARRCASLDRCDSRDAQSECERQDRISSSYIKHYFKRAWDDATAYKLVLNAGALDFEFDKALGILKAAL